MTNQPELITDVPEGVRWQRRGEIVDIPVKPVPKVPKAKTKRLAESIKNIEEGQQQAFFYDKGDHAGEGRRDQQLLGYATDLLGWNKGKPPHTRSYSSSLLDKNPKETKLIVRRLTQWVPTRRYK
jgi:hypothetical protein